MRRAVYLSLVILLTALGVLAWTFGERVLACILWAFALLAAWEVA